MAIRHKPHVWKCVIPNAKLNRSLKKWTEAERLAEVEAAAGSGNKASAAAVISAAEGSSKQSKGAKGSSSAAAAPKSTAKSKAAASASAAGSSQGLGSQKVKKNPLPPPVDPPLEVDSSQDEIAEEEEEPKVSDMVVDPDHDVSRERERSISASATTRLPLSSRTGARLELRSNQEAKQSTPRRTWRGSRAAAEKGTPLWGCGPEKSNVKIGRCLLPTIL